MGLGIRRRLRRLLDTMNTPSDAMASFLAANPKKLAAAATGDEQIRNLTDHCMAVLEAAGPLPAPDYAPTKHLQMPKEQWRLLDAFGSYMKDCRDHIAHYRKTYSGDDEPIFLDVGGNRGEMRKFAEGYKYWLVDLTVRTDEADRTIEADICKPLPIEHGTVDVIFSNQVWEHLERPWLACQELGKLLKPGGLFLTATLFAYRYHPLPEDFFRYTHKGLTSIHEEFAGTETIACNYDIHMRRYDHRGGAHSFAADMPPVDHLGGWRENWFVYYIGRKKAE